MCEIYLWIWVRKASLNVFLIDIIIIIFIKYELNWMVMYDVISIFVNDMEWWLRHNIFRKWDTLVEIVCMCIICEFDLRRYLTLLVHWNHHRIDEDY